IKFLYNDLVKNQWRPPEYFVFYVVLFIIAAALFVWFIYISDRKRIYDTEFDEPVDLTAGSFRDALGEGTQPVMIGVAMAVVFSYVFVLFFTSFFTYKEGFWKAFEAYNIW